MMLDVLAYHFCRHFVAYGSGEVSVLPQFPSPQPPLYLWVLTEDGSRAEALKSSNHLGDRIPRRERAEDVNMVCAYFHLIYRDVVSVGYLLKHLAHTISNRPLQDILAILGRPYQMVCGIVGGVCCSSENHARIVANSSHLGIGHRALAKMLHPSPPQAAGH